MFQKLARFIAHIFEFDQEPIDYIPATIVVAMDDETYGIGFEGSIPWKVPNDMKFFKETTMTLEKDDPYNMSNILICGKNTYVSLGSKNLKHRHMIVISSELFEYHKNRVTTSKETDIGYQINDIVVTPSVGDTTITVFIKKPEDCIMAKRIIDVETRIKHKHVFVVGGSKIYDYFINKPFSNNDINVDKVIITRLRFTSESTIKQRFGNRFDTFFPFNLVTNKFKYEGSNHKIIGDGHFVEKFSRKFR